MLLFISPRCSLQPFRVAGIEPPLPAANRPLGRSSRPTAYRPEGCFTQFDAAKGNTCIVCRLLCSRPAGVALEPSFVPLWLVGSLRARRPNWFIAWHVGRALRQDTRKNNQRARRSAPPCGAPPCGWRSDGGGSGVTLCSITGSQQPFKEPRDFDEAGCHVGCWWCNPA